MSESTDLHLVASTPHGRRFLLRVIRASGCDSPVFTGEVSRDTFNAGRQSIGMMVRSWLQHESFDDYIKMLQEEHDDVAARRSIDRD